MSTMLEFVTERRNRMMEDWRDDLKDKCIYDDVAVLFDVAGNTFKAQAMLKFIVLAYDAKSEAIAIHKDRTENKKQIMEYIAGISWFTDELYMRLVFRKSVDLDKVIEWYIDYQKDWRWKTVVSYFEYHSEVMNMKPSALFNDAKETLAIGRCMDEATKRRQEADKLWQEMKKEFVNLDTALVKEGMRAITDMGDFMSHEGFIAKMENEQTMLDK